MTHAHLIELDLSINSYLYSLFLTLLANATQDGYQFADPNLEIALGYIAT